MFEKELLAGLHACDVHGGRLLVAVSGGADSVALLRGIVALRESQGIEPLVAHLDHALREESATDARFVVDLADRLEVTHCVARSPIVEIARERGLGIEECARDARYTFLRDVAVDVDCHAIAVAHTADDQVETVLHHLLRGTGLGGLCGMPRVRPLDDGIRLVRPLLDVRRSEVESYLHELDQPYLEDASNQSSKFTRNRIRSGLIPLLKRDFNPRAEEAILRLSQQAEEASAVVEEIAIQRLDDAWLDGDATTGIRLRVSAFEGVHDHVIRAAFVELWRRMAWPRQRMGFGDWSRLARLVRNGRSAISLPDGFDARTLRGELRLTRRQRP